jgi:hypothetical protein
MPGQRSAARGAHGGRGEGEVGVVYVFYRSAQLALGDVREQMTWSLNITEKVNQISELTFSLWTTVFSPGVGTLVWSTAAEDLATLQATDDKLMVDDGYDILLEHGAKYMSSQPIEDGLLQVLNPQPMTANAPAPAYATVVSAVLAPGRYVRGVEMGLQIAERATQASGVPISFSTALSGVYGGVAWMGDYESIEHLQQAQQALSGEMSFVEFLDKEANDCYLPGQVRQTVFRRLA